MAKFSSENQPKKGRGKSERTKWIEALERNAYSEEKFQDAVIEEAMVDKSPMALDHVLKRISPIPKATAPAIDFKLKKGLTPYQIAESIMLGISDGEIPPDIGATLIQSMTGVLKIKEVTDFEERLKALEDADKD